MRIITNTDSEHWPTRISSADGNVYIECARHRPVTTSTPDTCREQLEGILKALLSYRALGFAGEAALRAVLTEAKAEGLAEWVGSVAYVEPDGSKRVYAWPESQAASHLAGRQDAEVQKSAFAAIEWAALPLYRGNYGPVSNVRFSVSDAALIHRGPDRDIWFILLDAKVFEQGNDALLQKTAFVEVMRDGSCISHEEKTLLENAGGGGPYDIIMSDCVVTARGDVIAAAGAPHGNVLVSLDLASFGSRQIDTFQTPSRELVPVARDVDAEVMKYLRRFPEHVTEMPPASFEKIVAEVLASHGFSDIQLNVQNAFGEIDIIAFESTKEGKRRGYIIECKRYNKRRKVTLREAHVLAMKRIHMAHAGIDRAMLVTTSDFTSPTRTLYDSAWGMELRAHDEVIEWLRTYKPPKDKYYV